MDNCANQLVLYGASDAIAALQGVLSEAGAICLPLPFDRGYHTADFADVSAAFHAFYRPHQAARTQGAALFLRLDRALSRDRGGRAQARRGAVVAAVRFRETVERMVADGVSCFVEVGPSGNLTAFVNDTPGAKEATAVASNLRRKGGVEQLLTVLAQLYASGRPVRVDKLFAGRRIADVDLGSAPAPQGAACISTTPCRCCATRSASGPR
jgi:acyl transferase domain-containing protein